MSEPILTIFTWLSAMPFFMEAARRTIEVGSVAIVFCQSCPAASIGLACSRNT